MPSEAERALAILSPAGIDPSELSEPRAIELAHEFEKTADSLERTHRGLTEIAQRLGLNIPDSAAAAEELCDVVALAGAEHRPLELCSYPEEHPKRTERR